MSESTLVKMPHCWKSRVTAHLSINSQVNSPAKPQIKTTRDVVGVYSLWAIGKMKTICNSYSMGCPPVRGDNPLAKARAGGQTWFNYFIPPTSV